MAKPKLALIPAAQGTKLYSVLPSDGVGDFTFARGSVATRINAQGLIENVASGVSRLDYPMIDGVQKGCPHHILEPARTNLLRYSQDFSQSIWAKANTTLTPNTSISPDGSLNGGSLFETTTNIFHDLSQSYVVSIGVVYHFSCFVKPNGRDYCYLYSNSEGDKAIKFDIKKGIIIGAALGTDTGSKITNFGNGWYRIEIKITATSSGSKAFVISPTNNGSSSISAYAGDPSKGILVWGAMLEIGSYPTSYIPTSGTAVTRSAETATGAGNSTTFNNSEGVLMLEISRLNKADSSSEIISINDGSLSNYITLYYDSNGVAYVLKGSTERTGNFSMSANNQAIFNKIALKYKSQDVSLFVNGFEVDTNSGTLGLSGLNSLEFNHGNDAFDFYGKAKQIQYFDSILADTQLEQLTSWQSFTDMANGQLYTIE